MLKKLLLITAALTLLFCVGCSSEPTETTTKPIPETTVPSIQIPTTQATTTVPAITEPQKEFVPIILVENDDLLVKITGVDTENFWGYTLKMFLENKTEKELMFTVQDVSVNGFMCDPYWATSVGAGKKSNTEIHWLPGSFEDNGITNVEEITMTLKVYDSNDFQAEDVLNRTFLIQP